MKLLVFAAALALAPLSAQAQVAAGAVPNSFDDAPARAAPVAPPAVPAMSAPADARSEETLRAVIANAQAGTIDYSLMDEALVAQMREQEARLLPLIRSFGAVQAVDFVGTQNGADLFAVTFANAATQWVIGFNDAGKVDALLFRPAQ